MATVKQKKLAKEIVLNSTREKPLNKKAMLEKVGYTTAIANARASKVIEAPGVKEELEILGFTEEAAKAVVIEIMNSKSVDPSARLKATDQVFKITGSYAPEKSIVATLQVSETKRNKTNELISGFLGNKKNT